MAEMAGQQGRLAGRRLAFLATDGVEEVEYTEPRAAAERAGAQVELISIKAGSVQAVQHDLDKSQMYLVDRVVTQADPGSYDALVLPGGVVNPDRLRMNWDAVNFVRTFVEARKTIAAICHGPWTLAEADAVRDRTMTSYPSLRTDLRNAGARWVDEPVCVDGGLVTSRRPADLPVFCTTMVEQIAQTERIAAY